MPLPVLVLVQVRSCRKSRSAAGAGYNCLALPHPPTVRYKSPGDAAGSDRTRRPGSLPAPGLLPRPCAETDVPTPLRASDLSASGAATRSPRADARASAGGLAGLRGGTGRVPCLEGGTAAKPWLETPLRARPGRRLGQAASGGEFGGGSVHFGRRVWRQVWRRSRGRTDAGADDGAFRLWDRAGGVAQANVPPLADGERTTNYPPLLTLERVMQTPLARWNQKHATKYPRSLDSVCLCAVAGNTPSLRR
jgi:hypothetical protein